MNRKKLITVAGLAVLALACSETVGGMMQDAGAMLADAGDMMQPDAGAQDTPVECNKSETVNEVTLRWAEFEVTPGRTEITVCSSGDPEATLEWGRRDTCNRFNANWFDGTSTGFWPCSSNTKSITVHN